MNRYRFAVICAVVMVTMGLTPVASAELPEHDEEIFVWSVEDAGDDAASQGGLDGTFAELACSIMVGGGDTSDSPCEALGYDIGHTDSHVFFRWNMATLEFDGGAPVDFTLMFDSGFRGNHPGDDYNRNFEFLLGVNAEEIWVERAQGQIGPDEWEDWTGDVLLGSDRGAGTLTAALPLELLETRVDPERGALVGESFNVTRDPFVEVINEECGEEGNLPECTTWMAGFESDKINGAAGSDNTKYLIHPIGELKPRLVEDTISGDSPIIELNLNRPTWENHHYVWDAALFSGFTIDHALELDNGTVNLFVLDPNGDNLWESPGASGEGGGEVEDLEPGQEWTLRIEMADWAEGNITVQLEGLEYVPEGTGNNGNNGGSDENGNNGGGEGEGNETDGGPDIDSQDSPAPAVALLLVTLVGLFALARRR